MNFTVTQYEAYIVKCAIEGIEIPTIKDVVIDCLNKDKPTERKVIIHNVSVRTNIMNDLDLIKKVAAILSQLKKQKVVMNTSRGYWQLK